MNSNLKAEIEALIEYATEMGAAVKPILPSDIVVANFVALKCKYGCRGYAKRFSCPPHAPTPDETKKILSEYNSALMMYFVERDGFSRYKMPPGEPDTTKSWVQKAMLALERHAFMAGFYKAFSFSAHPCSLCARCIIKDDGKICRLRDQVRPSMEGSGIDVYQTASKIGWEIKSLEYLPDGKCTCESPKTYTLILID